MNISPGTQVGRYEIRSQLGAGGMAEVYLAEDTQLGRRVAIKFLPGELVADEQANKRLVNEARAAATLDHPNICAIYEVGEADGRSFIAMQYLEGETLEARIKSKPLELQESLTIAAQIADALAEAHSHGIIHRDIKPSNIMITSRGPAKVMDFGLARVIAGVAENEAETQSLLTTPGTILGTVPYMSPEQVKGEKLDARTDVFSFGVVLYEMLSGRQPFASRSAAETISAILNQEPSTLLRYAPNLPEELPRIARKCLEKDRNLRYQNASEVRIDLQRLKRDAESAQVAITAKPETKSENRVSSAEYVAGAIKRHQKGVVVALVLVAVVVTVLAVVGYKLLGRRNAPFQSVKIVKLTNTGHVGAAAISPDGKYVAYTVREGDQQSIWILHVATRSNAQIVLLADVSYGPATFSSDSNYIYYMAKVKGSPGELYQVPVLGGDPKRIIERVDTPVSFAPADKQFAFMRITEREIQLIVANGDGTGERVLTATPVEGDHFYGPPAWSPDGQLIACSYSTGESAMTLVGVSVADGTMKPLTSRKWRRVDRAAWLGDGSGLISNVVEQNAPGQTSGQIWYISYPEGSAHRISNDTNNYGIGSLSITADSSNIVSLQFEALTNIFIATANDFSRAKQITPGTGRRDLMSGLSWTSDGRLIYVSLINGHPELWLMNADGTENKKVTEDSPGDRDSAVSRDGRYIVFGSVRSGSSSIWRMDFDGRNPKPLTTGGPDGNPQISPDGRWVIYDRGFLGNLWKVSIEGGAPKRLTDKVSQYPAISPDGRFIACQYRESDSSPLRIAIIPFEGGAPVKLFDTSEQVSLPLRWSADGHAILYATERGAAGKLWSQPLDGGPPKQLADFNPDELFSFALSIDGRQLAFARGAVSRDIILITDSR